MQNYTTNDINLAAVLRASGYHICDLEQDKRNPRKIHFTFEGDDLMPKLIMQFWNGLLDVNIQKFILNRQLLKSLIYNTNQNVDSAPFNQTNLAQ